MADAEYDLRVSYRYHKMRERFFRLLDAGAKFFSLVALTALVAAAGNWVALTVAGLSAAATILAIVLDFSGMAGRHESLAREFSTALARFIDGTIDEKEAEALNARLGAREPTALRGLVQLCQDEQDAANADMAEAGRLGVWRRIRAQFGFGELPFERDAAA